MPSEITIEPMSGALGATVLGIDLASLDDATFDRVHAAFLEHRVLFFRDQQLEPEHYIAFAGRFGTLAEYPFATGLEGHPEITMIIKEPHQTSNFGGMWHSDTGYQEKPPKATMLYAIETPEAGGDTLFADMYLAYETLSDGMKALLEGRSAVFSSAKHAASLRGDHLETGSMGGKAAAPEVLSAEHPVVRTHPETGRKALYVNPAHTTRFSGTTREESAPILDTLFAHAVRPEFTCRFRWGPGSLTIWDNRCSQHCAINDYDGHRRVMQRITIEGERPE